MKKSIYRLMIIVAAATMMLCPQMMSAQTKPASGDGSSTSPFLIATASNLVWYQQYVNGVADGTFHADACAKLMADIDLSTVCSEALGSWTPIAQYGESTYGNKGNYQFSGTFDGNGHTISNLYIRGEKYLGLFGYIYNGTIKNLKMSNVDVSTIDLTTSRYCGCGSVAGYSYNTVFENIEIISGSISSWDDAGGITGGYAKATNCVNRATLHVTSYSGGISADHQSTMTDCENYGTIYVDATSYTAGQVGGVTGGTPHSGSTISNCKNFGNIIVTTSTSASSTAISEGIGGVVGHIFCATLTGCSNFGTITVNTAQSAVGQICGGGTTSNTISGISYIKGSLKENGSTVTSYYGSASFTTNSVSEITFYSCYVCFNLNGHGTNIPSQVVYRLVTYKATKPDAPTADGYAFGGWYTDAACTSAFSFSTNIIQNTTLYAKWTSTHTHTMVYQDNGDGTHSYCCKDGDYVESTESHTISYTDNRDGTHTASCSTCGHTESAESHTIVYNTNDDETHSEYCSVCKNVINTLSHDFLITTNDDGTFTMNCPTCSYKNYASYIYGDIDSDGKIDITDVALLVKVLKGEATATPQCNAHSADDEINLSDLEAIKEIIFGNRGITFEATSDAENIEKGGDNNNDISKTAEAKSASFNDDRQ